jgi:hypothetical protein
MQIRFPFSKKVRVLDTSNVPEDVLELIIRRGVLEMAKDDSTKCIIRQYSHFITKERPNKITVIG